MLINDDADDGRIDKDGNKGGMNQSPKGNMWSAIPVALLCIIVNLRGEAGQQPRRGQSPVGGLSFVRLSASPSMV